MQTELAQDRGQQVVEKSSAEAFLMMAEQNRELLKQIVVVVPVRPAEGLSVELSQILSVWYGEGLAWTSFNDFMGGFIEVTRGKIAYDFKNEYDQKYLLMIDSDMKPDVMTPFMLARHDQPVVGACALSVSKRWGPQLCFTIKDTQGEYRFPTVHGCPEIPATGLCEVGHVGTGCILIRRDVIESFTYAPGDIPFFVDEETRVRGAMTGELLRGEDISFCRQVRAKGFPVHVDLECHSAHRKLISMVWPDDQRSETLTPDGWVLPEVGMKFKP